jgi:hypothetical protein
MEVYSGVTVLELEAEDWQEWYSSGKIRRKVQP